MTAKPGKGQGEFPFAGVRGTGKALFNSVPEVFSSYLHPLLIRQFNNLPTTHLPHARREFVDKVAVVGNH